METATQQRPSTGLPNHAHSSKAQRRQTAHLFLIVLSFVLLPLSISLAITSYLLHIMNIQNGHRRKDLQSSTFRPKTILITGVGSAKGLHMARAFYELGHRVIGADFELLRIPTCGRLSKALRAYHILRLPTAGDSTAYMRDLVAVVEKHNVDLWLSCSDVVSAYTDAQAKELLEQRSPCRSLQASIDGVKKLAEPDDLMHFVRSIGLPAPEIHEVRSRAAVHKVLNEASGSKEFTIEVAGRKKGRGLNHRTMLPRRTLSQTYHQVSKIDVSKDSPWILQQYLKGKEYSTFSIVINNEVHAFAACPSETIEIAMEPLAQTSGLHNAMLKFIKAFASKCTPSLTSHLCFSFIVEETLTDAGVEQKIMPTGCNLQPNNSVLFFQGPSGSADLVHAYMTIFSKPPAGAKENGNVTISNASDISHVGPGPGPSSSVYVLGHDLVSLVLRPLLQLFTFKLSFSQAALQVSTFLTHVAFWHEAVFTPWDPLPALWLYHVYIPLQLLDGLWSAGGSRPPV